MLRVKLLCILFCTSLLLLCLPGLYLASTSPGALRRLTNTSEATLNLNPSLSGDGRHITFESTADLAITGGRSGFHALLAGLADDPATFKEMSATRAPAPAISQDGSFVAFASHGNPLGLNMDGNSEIFLYDGTTLRQLTDTLPVDASRRVTDGNFQPSMTDDGRLIVFSSNRDLTGSNADANTEIFLFETATRSFTQLTNTAAPAAASDARISGDGSTIAYLRENGATVDSPRELLLYDRVGGTTRVGKSNLRGAALGYGRALSDDGTRLVYVAETGADDAAQIFLFDAARQTTRQITYLETRAADVPLDAAISGDGTRLSFATRRNLPGVKSDHGVELYLFDIPTSQFAQLTNAPSNATAEVVSSLNDDGSIIAFNFPRVLSGPVSSSELANNSEIYSMSIPARPPFAVDLRIANAASLGHEPFQAKTVAPGSIALAYGSALAFDAQQAPRESSGNFPDSLGGTIVTVNGRPAQLFFVSPTQINFLVPPETEIGPASLVVINPEGFETRGTMEIARTAPGIFTLDGLGQGMCIALDALTLQAGPFDPTTGTRRVILFATGTRHSSQLDLSINGRAVAVESVQASPDLPGLDEIHLLLPADLRGAGTVDLSLRADGRESNPVLLTLAGEAARDIVINEILADPPDGLAGDANHDGTRSASQDEFVELVNSTERDMDLGGYQLLTRTSAFAPETARHTFASGTILPAGTALVIFGGANAATFNPHDAAFGGAQVLLSSTGGLSLINSGGIVTLSDSSGVIVDQLSYGGPSTLKGDANQSLTRSPDINGHFSLHKDAAGSNRRLFSPGTRVDGTPFIPSTTLARIELSPLAAGINIGAQQQFNARAFDVAGRELSGLIFRWQSSAATVAVVDRGGLASGVAEGTVEIKAIARGVESAPALLTVRPRERILTRILVNPSSPTINVGGTQVFTARALDQDEQELTGIVFNWSSQDQSVATIEQSGLASGLKTGSTMVTATARGIGGSATLNVVTPPLVINEVLADPPDGVAGDANHDGLRSGTDDEFVELVNSSTAALDISGWTIRTKPLNGANETARHTFANGTILPAGDALVVFGGGAPDARDPVFGGAQVMKASGNGLSLSNGGLDLIIRDAAGNFVTQFAYGTNADNFGGDAVNQSITRSPDVSGDFRRHSTANGAAGRLYSPGTKTDGAFFLPRSGQLKQVSLALASNSIFVGQSTELVAQALDQFNRPLPDAALAFTSNDTSVATIEMVTTEPSTGRAIAIVTGRERGTAQLGAIATSGANNVTSEALTLMVQPAPPKIARVELTPASSTINRGGAQQLKAIALDQNNQFVADASFAWTTSDTNVASVSAGGLATGSGIGTVTITASTPDGAGGTINGTATLQVEMPLFINEVLADVPPDNTSTTGIIEGDANRDGTRNSGDDEFIELLNNSSAPLDLSAVRIFDSGFSTPRFTFPANTTLAAGRAVVIFGGGSPPLFDPAFGGALILTTANSSSLSSTLSLNDGGDSINLRLLVGGNDVAIASLTYGATGPIIAPSNQSLTRSPDTEISSTGGGFVAHTAALNAAGRLFSPGTRSDGTPFGSPPITRIEISPSTATINFDGTQAFKARAYSSASGPESEITAVSFIWDSTDTARANVSPNTGPVINASAVSAGSATIRARAGGQEAAAALTINPPPSVLTSVTLTPASASVTEGHTAQFSAQALDQFGQPMKGISFAFASSDAAIATIESVNMDESSGLATAIVAGHNRGTAQLTARATDGTRSVTSQPSMLNVNPAPPVITRIEVSPASATVGAGATEQFTARAFDQNNQFIPGTAFAWSSSNPVVATINTDGLATALSAGTTQLIASAGSVKSDPATLIVTAPPIPREGEVIINEALISFASSTTQTRHDFLELYNTSNQTLDISGLLISFRPGGSSNTPGTVTLPGVTGGGTTLIQPHGYFLVVNGTETFGATADFNAAVFDLNNTTGGIKLEIEGVKLDGFSYQGGSAAPASPFSSYGEGPVFVFTSGTTNDLIRSPNAIDTGDNASNFRRNGTAASVTPKAVNPTLP